MTQYEIIQKRALNWILHSKYTNYKDKLKRLQLLPLPMYIQLNNLLLLAKLIFKRYDTYMIDVPQYIVFSRYPMFQLKRPSKYRCEQNFFYQTCRLANAPMDRFAKLVWTERRPAQSVLEQNCTL